MTRIKGLFTTASAIDWIGPNIVVSDWVELTQKEVSEFGKLTKHHHWLHLNPERANNETSFGGTIAQGFFMLNYIIHFIDQTGLRPTDAQFSLNYGLDKVRFVQAVPVADGFQIRDRIGLSEVSLRKNGSTLIKTTHNFEVKGIIGTVLYAEWLALWSNKCRP